MSTEPVEDVEAAEADDEQWPVTTPLQALLWGIPGYGTGAAATDSEAFGNPNFR